MKIVNKFPPNYDKIKLYYPNLEDHKPVFCWGEEIFNPFEVSVTKDIEIHEEVHSKRQANNLEEWWYNYLNNQEFRLEEEIMAYGTQYAFIKKMDMKRNLKDWKLEKMAQALSGKLYGSIISYGEAESKIRNYAKKL